MKNMSIRTLGLEGADKKYLDELDTLKNKVAEGKLTVEQLQGWIDCERALYGKCFTCGYINEFGGGACWNCDD